MKARTAVWFMVAALAVPVAGADDETSPLSTLAPGDRVRAGVLGNRETLTATIESVTADELILRSTGRGQPLRLSLEQLDRLEVARGSRSQWRKGAVIGLIPGAVLGGLIGIGIECDAEISGGCVNEGGAVATSALVGAAVGGVVTGTVGALVGLAFKTDQWVRLYERKVKVSLMLTPTGRETRFGLAVSF